MMPSSHSSAPVLEMVPNFAEGRDAGVLSALAEALTSEGAYLADLHVDVDHNRSVFSVFGTADSLVGGALAGCAVALDSIDLTRHTGVHPRTGACDVVPFVSLQHDCDAPAGIALANDQEVGEAAHAAAVAIGEALGIPVIAYGGIGQQASSGTARSGGIDGIAQRLAVGSATHLAGPQVVHPTAGVVLVGTRPVLIACNVVLDTRDLELAQRLSTRVRERDGGLPGVRALAFDVPHMDAVQVSCNIEQWQRASPADVVHMVRELLEAEARSAQLIRGLELVGLAPARAIAQLEQAGIDLLAAPEPRIEAHLERLRML